MTQEFRTPPGMCPNCGALLDAATDAGFNPFQPRGPSEGDFSICVYCATPLRFEDEGRLKLLEEKDLEGAPREFVESLAEMQRMAKMHLALQGKSEQAKPKLPN